MAFALTSLIPGVGYEYAHVATASIVTIGLSVAGVVARKQLLSLGSDGSTPAGTIGLKAAFEGVTELAQGLADIVLGKEGRKYVPFFASVFMYVFVNNLVGMIPGMTPATENMNTSFAMGVIMFLVYNYYGFKESGLGYLKHFAGPSLGSFLLTLLITPIIMVVEIVSNAMRPLTLGLRLSNVLKGDHSVVGVFTDMAPYLVPIPFYTLGLLVALIQAVVFTLLSMIYISLATAHDH